MTTKTDIADLLACVEAAREATHPDLDSDLVRRVVEIEHAAEGNESAAQKAIKKLVEDAVQASIDSGKG